VLLVIRNYYAAAGQDDGARACSLLYPTTARSLAAKFGKGSAGPSYLRGATTCDAVMTRLFEHHHAQLAAPVESTGVRVEDGRAYVLLGSRTAPASSLLLRRRAGSWKVDEALGKTLP
jgi:hypothetical protein